MERDFAIRESLTGDRAAIEALYARAFPEEDLLPLVCDLLRVPDCALSLVVEIDSRVVGNVILTKCGVDGCNVKAALLAPLAVQPENQRQGVGSALVRAGLRRLRDAGFNVVFVLGDPGYYGRFGFRRERSVKPPYNLPAEWSEAWQSTLLGEAEVIADGKLVVPPVWRDAALWAP